jgi:hypothetical protein
MARALGVPVEWLVDDEMAVPPPIPTTDRESDLWKVVRTIGLDEAWRRLVQAPQSATGEDRPFYQQGKAGTPEGREERRGAG